ncbi:PAS domain-containing protein [Methylobacterium durans]|uniref:PAS domain-containing protein n=1 Tax=Methylobacterium durans TaxID=2202825 RepID=UPI002AFF3B0E|nr:PAS domain-containing protein [Methylobacterium durans]MEA1832236.1 PAS domain-containing protein [Methylobacterium durans]
MRDDALNRATLASSGLAFSSREFLRLIESCGLTGTWGWTFATNEQVWSPGLYRILGLQPDRVRPSYDLFLSLVHPDDRTEIETAAQVMHDGILHDHIYRVIRPDGSLRILSGRGEVYLAADGRPRAAAGIVLDVTGQEQLARAQAAERRRKQALFEQARVVTHTLPPSAGAGESPDLSTLTGLAADTRAPDEDLSLWRETLAAGFRSGNTFTSVGTLSLPDGSRERFQTTLVPMRDVDGTILEWISLVQPANPEGEGRSEEAAEFDEGIEGYHLRAARGLLDWSMTDLANASNLSFSTIRRLEENAEGPANRSRRAVISALREAGIRFPRIDGGTVAVAKT